ncbi:MAG: PhzF family phenazine biosynthesis protein [Dehalococcoidia bacterium]
MKLPFFIIDAFAPRPMGGNPAVVIPLELLDHSPNLDDDTMLAIARELRQPMVAFVGPPDDNRVRPIRWIHEDGESDFCGHATFASGHVILDELQLEPDRAVFDTCAGRLIVERNDPAPRWHGAPSRDSSSLLSLIVPAISTTPVDDPRLARALDCTPQLAARGDLDILVLVDSHQTVANMTPDWSILRDIDARGVVVTAPAHDSDTSFVSRFFATTPEGYEDAATGSGHAMLTPFWSQRLNAKRTLHALQLSPRGGEFWCDLTNDSHVRLTSRAFTYSTGHLLLSEPALGARSSRERVASRST